MPGLDVIQEAGRQLVICNACRYCEGYCPVFRAIETRRDFKQGDVFYLSNLCHDCRACYYACMYTPPHEFAINIPQILAEARMETYRRWSWPDFLGRAFKNRSVTVFLATGMAALVAVLALLFIPSENLFTAHLGPGAFYEVVPYLAMVAGALILFFYGIAVWLRGGARFWSETRSALNEQGNWKTLAAAVGAALGLRYLKGGGPGCFYPDERPSSVRRVYHSLTFWGFLSDFVSTTLAFIYQDFLHILPPYSLTSAPVIFGSDRRRGAHPRNGRPDLLQIAKRSRARGGGRFRHGLRFSGDARPDGADGHADADSPRHDGDGEHSGAASGVHRGPVHFRAVRKIRARRLSHPRA